MHDKLSEAMRLAQEDESNRRRAIEQAMYGFDLASYRGAIANLAPVAAGISEAAKRMQEQMRAVTGSLEEFARSPAIGAIGSSLAQVSLGAQALADYKARFQLPDLSETARIIQGINTPAFAQAVGHIRTHTEEMAKAIEAMRSPWLDMQNQMQSIRAFTELQGIGTALRELPAFNDRLVGQLRDSLGDWRPTIDWPEAIFSDIAARHSFYIERGLSAHITDFPAEAFDEGMEIAGLVEPSLEYPGRFSEEDDEPGLQRTNAAHDRLMRFEIRVRRFIETLMAAQFGEHWIKHRVPGELRKKWQNKLEVARSRGEKVWPLIAYADFTDYVPIITRSDNWETVFKPIFYRADAVIESFQRLYPIRICTMHARIITQDDELYMHVEIKRLLSAIEDLN